jgi:hypothetical protein
MLASCLLISTSPLPKATLPGPMEMIMVKKGSEPFAPSSDDSVLEVALMLSRRQFDLLEQRAHRGDDRGPVPASPGAGVYFP